jgi:tRNA (guanine-N7-)-methyltransferase
MNGPLVFCPASESVDLRSTGPQPALHPPRLYGRRRGRALRVGQAALKHDLLPQLAFQLPEQGAPLDPHALFPGRDIWLEIGFGGGEHLVWQAARHPDKGLIGCDVFENGIVKLLGRLAQERLANVRIFPEDARLLLAALPPRSLGRVFILFPDPWPKLRHHKRRIVSPATLGELARVMIPGSELRLATDDPPYLRAIVDQALRHPLFEWLARRPADWRDRAADWPPTRYETKALAAGRRPVFLRLRRRD